MFTKPPFNASRRSFLKEGITGIAAIAGLQLTNGCKTSDRLAHIKGGIVGANHQTGHLLRHPEQLPHPSSSLDTDVLIVGGGVSGLSAKRWLTRYSNHKVLLLEMDTAVGGNARYGENAVSAYPWGAHYLPIPDIRNTELIDFLKECGSVETINETGLPVYNVYHLCHDPEERLFINGYWQEGLVPDAGVPAKDKAQITRFFREMETWKNRIGSDGLDAFAIPVQKSSSDPVITQLHDISFEQYLQQQQYTSAYLKWYLEYGCKDDYGADLKTTSAWAGIHYFAARKGKGAHVNAAAILTWPEGNGFLVKQLKQQCNGGIQASWLVYEVRQTEQGAIAFCYDVATKSSIAVTCRKLIMATPVAVNKRVLKGIPTYETLSLQAFKHTPWVIANITLDGLPQGKGMPLCWDNVLYNTRSVGYVNANHQNLNDSSSKVITVYLPLVSNDADQQRMDIYNRTYRHWLDQLVTELEIAHKDIATYISHADIWIWGHGMIAPAPGFINSAERKAAAAPVNNTIFFAHTDLSGISIFEEAFYQGIHAAKQLITV